jgi:hypothetical protein
MAPPRSVARRDRELAARAAPLRAALVAWSRAWLARQRPMITARGYEATKARGDVSDLARLLRLFGLARATDAAGEEIGGLIRGDRAPALAEAGRLVAGATRWVDLATEIEGTMRARLADAVGSIITDAATRGQTVGDVTRRLATEIRAAPRSPEDDDERAILSWSRAETIARTEMGRAENQGRLSAYEATGVEELEWIAYSDGRSGDRHHERLDGVRIRRGETWRTPLGNRLRSPGDPTAPVEDTANCRCTMRPVRR